jgi:hypothetical protein
VMLVALGWGTRAALVAAVVAGLVDLAIGGPASALAFLAVVVLPAVFYSHLLGLARAPDGVTRFDGRLEWYPLSRVLVAIAWISGFAVVGAFAFSNFSPAEFTDRLMTVFDDDLRDFAAQNDVDEGRMREMFRSYVELFPLMAGIGVMASNTFNLWAAAAITRLSGRSERPKDDFAAATTVPKSFLAAFFVAAVVAAGDGEIAFLARGLAGALAAFIGIAGYGVVHVMTRGNRGRTLLLTGLYLATFTLFVLPFALMIALGAADAIFGIRRRLLSAGGGRP